MQPGGVYVLDGGPTSRILAAMVIGPLLSLVGDRKMGTQWGWRPFKRDGVATLLELVGSGKIRPIIDRRYELAELPDALRYLESGQARGKILITI